MRLISWNINSIRQRQASFLQDLSQQAWDVVLLQETKVQDIHFPHQVFGECGYEVAYWGQAKNNGVAILSRWPLKHVRRLEFLSPGQARAIEAWIGGIRVLSLYVPNGQALDHPAYQEKLAFLERLRGFLKEWVHQPVCTVVGGDFNVALCEEDMGYPHLWQNHILCSVPEQQALSTVLAQGWQDSVWTEPGKKNPLTWWSYRSRAWEKEDGLRLDYLLLSPFAFDRMEKTLYYPEWRARSHPSDHCPIGVELKVEDLR